MIQINSTLTSIIYFIMAALFILGLRQMSSPKTAQQGIRWAGLGMTVAIIATLLNPTLIDSTNLWLILIAMAIGIVIAWISGKKVSMTQMPQMIALYNGMGGGAAGAIAAVELLNQNVNGILLLLLSIIGAFIGTISLSSSIIAFAKLQGLIKRSIAYPFHKVALALMALIAVILGAFLTLHPLNQMLLTCYFSWLIIIGILMALPIGGANMPVVISLLNAMTGLAVGCEGFALNNQAMIVAGTLVGASGTMLTLLMAKAINSSISNIIFSAHSTPSNTEVTFEGTKKRIEANDAGAMLNYAQQVIIIPGYGMAVAQAQFKVWELAQALIKKGISVKFAIHPVAGRMPGHMNVLLAEAGVPYELITDMDEINAEFSRADAAIVIGANDVVNPAANTNAESPLYGMPILNVDQAKNTIIIKRGEGTGFSGVENELFYKDHSYMLYGDAQEAAGQIIQALGEA